MKDLPQSETKAPGVECRTQTGIYVITSNAERTRFTLWKQKDGYEKLSISDSPYKLYNLIYGEQKQKRNGVK